MVAARGDLAPDERATAMASLPSNPEAARLYAEGVELMRASESIVLNIAEGAQQQTGQMAKEHYRVAFGSARPPRPQPSAMLSTTDWEARKV